MPANEFIAGWWDDLNTPVSGTIYYQTLGVAPNRVLELARSIATSLI